MEKEYLKEAGERLYRVRTDNLFSRKELAKMADVPIESVKNKERGEEAVESDVMDKKPKLKSEGIFAHGFGLQIVLQGVMFAILSLAAFYIGKSVTNSLEGGQTMAFMVLAISQVVQAFNMRSEKSLFKTGFFGNRTLNLATLVSLVLVLIVLFTPVRVAFGLVTLPLKLYLIALGFILIPLVVMKISKAVGLIKTKH